MTMLSRTAENLFWMTRYMERAETMARLLEVGYRIALMPSAGAGHQNDWASILAAAGGAASGEVSEAHPPSASANASNSARDINACPPARRPGNHAAGRRGDCRPCLRRAR